MDKNVIQLFPLPSRTVPLKGLYLSHVGLAQLNAEDNRQDKDKLPMVYANFLTSIDGRIALKAEQENHFRLPEQLKSNEDFMLLLELYAHADCIITHGGYMRALSEGRLGNVLQLPRIEETEYIHTWREQRGMKASPDVAIVSGSLNFPWHSSLDDNSQKVHIATGGRASKQSRQNWQDRGHQVHTFGQTNHVDVLELMRFLQHQGYRSICLMAGPDLLQDMLEHGFVKHFFITMTHQLLGGTEFKTMLNGRSLGDSGRMRLENLYLDEDNSNSSGQWLAEFVLT